MHLKFISHCTNRGQPACDNQLTLNPLNFPVFQYVRCPSRIPIFQSICVDSFYLLQSHVVISAPGHGFFHDALPSDPQKREEIRRLTRPALEGGALVHHGTDSGGQLLHILLLYLTSTTGRPVFPLTPELLSPYHPV